MQLLDEPSPKNKKQYKKLILKKVLFSPLFLLFLMIFSLTPAPLSINEAMAASLKPSVLNQQFEVEQVVFRKIEKKVEEDIYKNREYLTLAYFEAQEKAKKLEILGKNVEYSPKNKDWDVLNITARTITAYNSEVAQCDDTPCITANGFDVCEHGVEDTIAANFLKFGTKVRIPDLFGDRIFIVRDRMNKRYSNRVDVWMIEKTDAKKFGVRIAEIEIVE